MIREVDVANLPIWLQSPRSQIDRLLSIYHLQSAKFVPKQPNQPNFAMELLIRILTDIRDLPENPRDNVYLTCKKLFSDFESMYPSSTFSRVSFALNFYKSITDKVHIPILRRPQRYQKKSSTLRLTH